eukprot:NODE_28827_length_465_cov_2.109467.p1 GENE.NODE_28827_length_465_cov_2.109467~~NODE_28827_length_465_cov_2.109467.p1  ORF type:complete len:117 (-),score=6.94 NODE_28827_length_465_cov_2.109467:77-427(-)
MRVRRARASKQRRVGVRPQRAGQGRSNAQWRMCKAGRQQRESSARRARSEAREGQQPSRVNYMDEGGCQKGKGRGAVPSDTVRPVCTWCVLSVHSMAEFDFSIYIISASSSSAPSI